MFKLLDSIEQPLYNEDKQLREYSEDAYIYTPHLVAVADGITNNQLSGRWIGEGYSDPYWLVHTFLNALKEVAVEREQTKLDDAKEVIRLALDKTMALFHPVSNVDKVDKPTCSFSMVMQHLNDKSKFTFVNICSNYIFYKDKIISPGPTLNAMNREFESGLRETAGRGFMARNKSLFKTIRDKIFYTNTQKGYPAVDLSYDCLDHPESSFVTETLDDGEKIMLTTDGLTRGLRLYDQYTEDNFFENCKTKGLQTILKEVRDLELSDWDRIKYPRFMATMDVCALMLEVKST